MGDQISAGPPPEEKPKMGYMRMTVIEYPEETGKWHPIETWKPGPEPKPEPEPVKTTSWREAERWGELREEPVGAGNIKTIPPVTSEQVVEREVTEAESLLHERMPGWYTPGGEHPHPTLEQWMRGEAPEEYYTVTWRGRGAPPEDVSIEEVMEHPDLYEPTPKMRWYLERYRRYRKEAREAEEAVTRFNLYVRGLERERREEEHKRTQRARELLESAIGKPPEWVRQALETRAGILIPSVSAFQISPQFAQTSARQSILRYVLNVALEMPEDEAVEFLRKAWEEIQQIHAPSWQELRLRYPEPSAVPETRLLQDLEEAMRTSVERAEAGINEYLMHGERLWYRVREALPGPLGEFMGEIVLREPEETLAPLLEMKWKLTQPAEHAGGLLELPGGKPGVSVRERPWWSYVGGMWWWVGTTSAVVKLPQWAARGYAQAVARVTERIVKLAPRAAQAEWEIAKLQIGALRRVPEYIVRG